MALAWLSRVCSHKLIAIIIDHGLRPTSCEEAAETAARLKMMGIKVRCARLLQIDHGKAIEEHARHMRYQKIFEICREEHCHDLLVAHQADDQIETFVKRQSFHSGPDGLASMGWMSKREGISIYRPLLGVSRQALRQTLRDNHISWFDDETNETTERGHIRKMWGNREEKENIWALSMQYGQKRTKRDQIMRSWLAQNGTIYRQGWISLGKSLPPPFILMRLIISYSNRPYPPDFHAVERICEEKRPCTLHGVRFVFWRMTWFMLREYADIPPVTPTLEGGIWDHRFIIKNVPQHQERVMIAPVGLGIDRKIRQGWPALFCATLPCLYQNGKRKAIPHLDWHSGPEWQDVTFQMIMSPPLEKSAFYGAQTVNGQDYFFTDPWKS